MGIPCTHPEKKPKHALMSQRHTWTNHSENPPFSAEAAGVGPYFIKQLPLKRLLELQSQWNRMLSVYSSSDSPFDSCFSDAHWHGKFLQLVKKGPPVQYRWDAWKAITKLNSRLDAGFYQDLPNGNYFTMCAIHKDLHRTFPSQPFFGQSSLGEIGRQALAQLLGRVAGNHSSLGYCQSMNFLGGFLLLVNGGNDMEAFFMMETLLEMYQLQDFYTEEMSYLKRTMWVFQELFQKNLPLLAKHFSRQEIVPELWVTKWFLTLFTNTLSPEIVVRIWDYFLIDRIPIFYRVSLAIVGKFEKELLALDTAGICEFLANLQGLEAESLLTEALKYDIKYNDVKKLERRHSFEESTIGETPKGPTRFTQSAGFTTKAFEASEETPGESNQPIQTISEEVEFASTFKKNKTSAPKWPQFVPRAAVGRKETESEWEQVDVREMLSDLEKRDLKKGVDLLNQLKVNKKS